MKEECNFGNLAILRQRLLKVISDEVLQCIDQNTYAYLQDDQQHLQVEAGKVDTAHGKYAHNRLKYYYIIKRFFYFLHQQSRSTRLADITLADIEAFLEWHRSYRQFKAVLHSYSNESSYEGRTLSKSELNAFFVRAIKKGLITTNPILPLMRTPIKIEPKNLTPQNQADYRTFQQYLELQVENGLIAQGTADYILVYLRVLLHDAEVRHMQNPEWPIELNELFSDPRWLAEWLNDDRNRSSNKHTKLAKGSIETRMRTIRYIWMFLESKGRASTTFYDDLTNWFRLPHRRTMIIRGRKPKIIEALSEKDEEAVFNHIRQHSRNKVLGLRDLAIFTTGLQTAMRIRSLHSMRIENFKELDNGVWVCYVQIKRSPHKTDEELDKLTEDKTVWDYWYISPQARAAIDKYLQVTDRNWQSIGSVWLTQANTPLSLKGQAAVIRKWLVSAGCEFINPHVLRHTAAARLLNKYRCSIPDVQAVTQHKSVKVLLEIYGKHKKIESYKAINQLFPVETERMGQVKEVVLTVADELDRISTEISQQRRRGEVFIAEHAEELMSQLRQQMSLLANILDYDFASEVIILTLDDCDKLNRRLLSFKTSLTDILGYQPQLEQLPIFKRTRRQPKSLLESR